MSWLDLATALSVDAADDGTGWAAYLELPVRAMPDRRRPGPDDADDAVRAIGAAYAGRGQTLADALRDLAEGDDRLVARATGLAADLDVLALLDHLHAWSAWAVPALIAGFQDGLSAAPFVDERRSGAFVDAVLAGRLTSHRVRAGAIEYGLDPDAPYRALRARVPATATVRGLDRDLALLSRTGRRSGMVAIRGEDAIGFLAAAPHRAVGLTIGLSAPVPLAGLPAAFRTATRVLDAARATGATGVLGLTELGIGAAIVADHEVTDRLLHRYIEPFAGSENGRAILATVEYYLANRRRPGPAGRDLYVHSNTVRYRIARFEAITGACVAEVRTMVEIWWALRAHRLRSPTPVQP